MDEALRMANAAISASILLAVIVTCHDLASVPARVRRFPIRLSYRVALTAVVALIGFSEGVMLFGMFTDYIRTPTLIETMTSVPWGLLALMKLAFRPFAGPVVSRLCDLREDECTIESPRRAGRPAVESGRGCR